MPKAWSNKDERQYEHVKEGAKKKGRSSKTAERIAAATVNKQRSSEGRTRTKSSSSKSRSGSTRKRSTSTRAKKK